jgi:hypothetical protein
VTADVRRATQGPCEVDDPAKGGRCGMSRSSHARLGIAHEYLGPVLDPDPAELRRRRGSLGLSLDVVALELAVDQAALSRYERGLRPAPSRTVSGADYALFLERRELAALAARRRVLQQAGRGRS